MKKLLAVALLISVLFSADVFAPKTAFADGGETAVVADGVQTTAEVGTVSGPDENGVYTFGESIVRCGLYYGTSALISANLANEVGSGYIFGYFDSSRSFHSVGYTASEKITTMKDANMYMLNGVYYDSLPPSGAMTIGAYHVQRPETFASYDEALAFASTIADAFPAYIDGKWVVRCGSYTSLDAASADAQAIGGSAVGGSKTCCTVTITATGQILFEFDMSGEYYIGIMPTGADKPVTWFKNIKYYGCFEYRRTGTDINVINVIMVGDYVKGVVPYEMGTNWPAEAMKAQAVCAASFARRNRNKHSSLGFDVCNTTCCQVYYGLKNSSDACNAACDAVRGLGLYYGDELCNTVYHSSNGGSTEAAVNVWSTDYPYLQPVSDTYEDLEKASYGHWSETYTGKEIQWILNAKNYSIGEVVQAYVSEYTDAGNVYSVTFVDASGKKLTFSKEAARTILSSSTLDKYTRSQRYTIVSSAGSLDICVNSGSNVRTVTSGTMVIGSGGNISQIANSDEIYMITADGIESKSATETTGEVVFTVTGSGWGHNVGMSQWGARGRAEAGWTCEQILTYYFTGTHLAKMD